MLIDYNFIFLYIDYITYTKKNLQSILTAVHIAFSNIKYCITKHYFHTKIVKYNKIILYTQTCSQGVPLLFYHYSEK